MNLKIFKADALLLLTAAIWGFAFVAQRAGMEHVGPYTFNAARFALGGLSLLPLLFLKRNTRRDKHKKKPYSIIFYGAIAGVLLFLGSSFQQVGLQYTTAGNAGFITGLYVILVPVIGLLWHQKVGVGVWGGALLAVTGMYFMSVNNGMKIHSCYR